MFANFLCLAHLIQNRVSRRFQAVSALQARHRWCLTGTPIQNRLEDLGALVEFLRVNPFDKPKAFKTVFLDPISKQNPIGWERLRSLVRAISLRRTKAALGRVIKLLPPEEVINRVVLDDKERRIYDLVKRRFTMAIDFGGGKMNAFQLILRLRQICNHGVDLLPVNLVQWIKTASEFDFHAHLSLEICGSCGQVPPMTDATSLDDLSCGHQICRTCRFEDKKESLDGVLDLACPLCLTMAKGQHINQGSPSSPFSRGQECYQPSSKVKALLQSLDEDKRTATEAGLLPGKRSVVSMHSA